MMQFQRIHWLCKIDLCAVRIKSEPEGACVLFCHVSVFKFFQSRAGLSFDGRQPDGGWSFEGIM